MATITKKLQNVIKLHTEKSKKKKLEVTKRFLNLETSWLVASAEDNSIVPVITSHDLQQNENFLQVTVVFSKSLPTASSYL